ncbi:MAG: hypothetical protein AAF288_03030 [Planctomycetota bacterium]
MPSVIDERIRRWRLELSLRHGLLRQELDELEDHVRREVAESLGGVDLPSDDRVRRELEEAIDRLGDSRAIARELRKSRGWDVAYSLAGFGVMGFLALSWLLLGGQLGTYVDIPSLVFMGGVLGGGLCATYRPRRVWRSLSIGFLRRPPEDLDELAEAQGVFEMARTLCWSGGVLAALGGGISMLSDLRDPTSIGAGTAVMLLTVLYGGMLAEFFFAPMRQTVKARRDQVEAAAGLAAV